VSILHRASGALMFVLLPFMIWLFDTSVTSEISYERFTSAFTPASASCRAGSSSWWCWP
jgi:succinate dehydrogenase / fumarate reductase, cytochrome b subunit